MRDVLYYRLGWFGRRYVVAFLLNYVTEALPASGAPTVGFRVDNIFDFPLVDSVYLDWWRRFCALIRVRVLCGGRKEVVVKYRV